MTIFLLMLSFLNMPISQTSTLPESLFHDYTDQQGRWYLSLEKEYALLEADFWTYASISENNDQYEIILTKTDTLCYYNTEGRYVCELKNRLTTLQVKPDVKRTLSCSQDGRAPMPLYRSDKAPPYQGIQSLPSKQHGGIAKLKGIVDPDLKDILSIKVSTPNFLFSEQLSYTVWLEPDGSFQLDVPLPGPQDVYLVYGDHLTTLFLAPEESLMVNLTDTDPRKWLFMGPTADLSRDIASYKELEGKALKKITKTYHREDIQLAAEPHRQKRLALKNKQEDYFKDYSSKHAVSPAFVEWFGIHTTLTFYDDLIRYSWLHNMGKSRYVVWTTEHPTYFNFLDEFDYSDPKLQYSMHYGNYTRELIAFFKNKYKNGIDHAPDTSYWQMMRSESLTPDERSLAEAEWERAKHPSPARKLWKALWIQHQDTIFTKAFTSSSSSRPEKALAIILEKAPTLSIEQKAQLDEAIAEIKAENERIAAIRKKYPHISQMVGAEKRIGALESVPKHHVQLAPYAWGGVMQRHLEVSDAKRAKYYLEKVKTYPLDQSHRDLIQWAYDELLESQSKPLPAFANLENVEAGTANEFLQKLTRKHQNKVIYLDIWATWCSPCRSQFEYAANLKAANKDKDVVFVYLCVSGDKSNWKNLIKKYQLDGDHYFVDKSIYQGLDHKFNIQGYPTYMILNKEGRLVERKAPWPYDTEKLNSKLAKYAAQ